MDVIHLMFICRKASSFPFLKHMCCGNTRKDKIFTCAMDKSRGMCAMVIYHMMGIQTERRIRYVHIDGSMAITLYERYISVNPHVMKVKYHRLLLFFKQIPV